MVHIVNGRPAGPDISAAQLLERYEDAALNKRRKGRPHLPTRAELANAVGRQSATSIRSWCRAEVYNLPWPLFGLDEPVCLVDALGPRHEVLYVNAAMCDLVGWGAGELLYQPSSLLIAPGHEQDAETLARRTRARALKDGDAELVWLPAWFRTRTGDCLRIEEELRYGPVSDAYFARVRALGMQLAWNVEQDVWVDLHGQRCPGLPPAVQNTTLTG